MQLQIAANMVDQWDFDRVDQVLALASEDPRVPLDQISSLECVVRWGRKAQEAFHEEAELNGERIREMHGPSYTTDPTRN